MYHFAELSGGILVLFLLSRRGMSFSFFFLPLSKVYLFFWGVGAKGRAEARVSSRSPRSVELDAGLGLRTVRSQPELKPRVGHVTDYATKVP